MPKPNYELLCIVIEKMGRFFGIYLKTGGEILYKSLEVGAGTERGAAGERAECRVRPLAETGERSFRLCNSVVNVDFRAFPCAPADADVLNRF